MEIQYDRAQKLTFLKLKRMSWDRVARAGSFVARWPCVFLQEDGGESITTCIFVLSHLLRCYIRKRCSNQTHGRVAGRAACGASRERNSTEKFHLLHQPHTLCLCVYAGTERKKTHTLKHLHPCCVQLQLHLEIFFIFNLLMA